MCVCVYVCVCVCVCVCVWCVCVCVCVCVCLIVCLCECACVCLQWVRAMYVCEKYLPVPWTDVSVYLCVCLFGQIYVGWYAFGPWRLCVFFSLN